MKGLLIWIVAVAAVTQVPTETAPVKRVVDDYVGLYRKDSLEKWKQLFLPSFKSTSTNSDGSVTTRTLEEFYQAQRRGFAEAQEMSESLENVRIERHGRLASAWADFVFRHDGTSRRGRLVLTLVEEGGVFRIAGLMFSY